MNRYLASSLIICAVFITSSSSQETQVNLNKYVRLTFGDVGPRRTHPFHASLRYIVYTSKNFIIHHCSAVVIAQRFLITIYRCLQEAVNFKSHPHLVLRYVAIVGEEKHHLNYVPEHLTHDFGWEELNVTAPGSRLNYIVPLRLNDELQLSEKIRPIKVANKTETERYLKAGTVLTAYSVGIMNNSKVLGRMGSRVQRTRVIVDPLIPCDEGYICTKSKTVIPGLTSEDRGSALVVRRKSKNHLLIGLMTSGNIIFGVSKWILVHPFAEALSGIVEQCS